MDVPCQIRTSEVTHCSSCEGPGALLYGALEDRLFGIPGKWSLLRCDRCAWVWLNPRPVAADIGLLYRDYHTHDDEPPPSALQRAVRYGIAAALLGYDDRRPGFASRLLARVGPLAEAGMRSAMGLTGESRGRLLDVGCGAGLFLETMQALGWEVSGTEIDAAAAAVARQRLGGAQIHEGALEDLELRTGHYQAVTLAHVIEHLLDPVDALRACGRLLAPGGRVAIVTPNAGSLGRHAFGADWRGWEPPRHIQVYEAPSLVRAVEEAGLRVISSKTVSSAAYYLYLESARLRGESASPARAVAFWLREYVRASRGAPCGEELLLIAEASTAASTSAAAR